MLMYFHQNIVVPKLFKNMNHSIKQIYQYNPMAFITLGVFKKLDVSQNTERTIFVEGKEKKNGEEVLKNIQIKTVRDTPKGKKVTQFIIARKAIVMKKKYRREKPIRVLRLYKGYSFLRNPDSNEFQKVDFSNGVFDLHLHDPEQRYNYKTRGSVQELENEELMNKINQLKKEKVSRNRVLAYIIELHKRSALPFSSFIFILLGFPMAILNQRSTKGFGLGLSVIFIFLYFTLFLSTDTIAIKWYFLPLPICAWLANLSMIFFVIYFYRKRLLD